MWDSEHSFAAGAAVHSVLDAILGVCAACRARRRTVILAPPQRGEDARRAAEIFTSMRG